MPDHSMLRNLIEYTPGISHFIQWERRIRLRRAGVGRHGQQFYQQDLVKGLGHFKRHSDISDHLNTLFALAVEAQPRLIVELGTRGGESTRALLAGAALTSATMLSLDIEDFSGADINHRARWYFVKADDVSFAGNGFVLWCAQQKLPPVIDLLFIDTSHEYEHTCREIAAWSPFLSAKGVMIFHDTNMGKGVYARLDGSFGCGWDNQRAVIRAIEKFLGRQYSENDCFTDVAKGFLVTHHPHCNGLTVLKKIPGRLNGATA